MLSRIQFRLGVVEKEATASTDLHSCLLDGRQNMQDDDDEATGGRSEEASYGQPRTNKRAILEESSDEDD